MELPEPPLGISSPVGGDIPQPREFWFNVNAELVVYGAAEPGARVTYRRPGDSIARGWDVQLPVLLA